MSGDGGDQDRAAVRALVDTLPRCPMCATVGVMHVPGGDGAWCEAHAFGPARDLPYAAPLRALLERMATWTVPLAPALTCRLCGQVGHTALSCFDTSDLAGHVAPDAPPSPLTAARAERDRLRVAAESARDDYMRAECHARALGAEPGESSR